MESLLLPNARIKEGYHSVLITTRDGQEHNGMIQRETVTEVVMRDAASREVSIPTRNIAHHAAQPEQLGHGRILPHTFDMRETPSVHQRGQHCPRQPGGFVSAARVSLNI